VSTNAEPSVLLTCSLCGDSFQLSARRARDWRDREPICKDCRRGRRELTDEERAQLRDWWLQQSGLRLDELQQIGRAIWPGLAA
jgi:transposase-like protein